MSENNERMDKQCRRCGVCCRKGGPALHGVDLELVGGAIPLKDLYTIRPGEMVLDNVRGRVATADADIIKIKSQPGEHACIFFDETGSACRIYADRPIECREMACWETDAILKVYDRDRLDRHQILSAIPAMIELIGLHENECGMADISRLVHLRKSGEPAAAADIADKIGYDAALRKKAAAAWPGNEDFMEFLFGRSLHQIVPLQFNIPVRRTA